MIRAEIHVLICVGGFPEYRPVRNNTCLPWFCDFVFAWSLLDLAAGTINQRLAAVPGVAYEAAGSGLLGPELAAGICRVEGVKQLGSLAGNWLTRDQAQTVLEKADGEELLSLRDPAMILDRNITRLG